MKRTFRVVPGKGIVASKIISNSNMGTYRGIQYGLEDSGDQRWYFRIQDNQFRYADTEEELLAKIDDYLQRSKELISSSEKISAATSVDLSEAFQIGLRCIDELRKEFPEIPKKCKFRRSHAWSSCWYITWYLEIPVKTLAHDYASENSTKGDSSDLYWEYINDFSDRCNQICKQPEFYNDLVQCHVDYFNDTDAGPTGAVLRVYDLTTKS